MLQNLHKRLDAIQQILRLRMEVLKFFIDEKDQKLFLTRMVILSGFIQLFRKFQIFQSNGVTHFQWVNKSMGTKIK